MESETSTTDPSSCTATTLTGTDTILPVRMAVLRISVSCVHTQTRAACQRSSTPQECHRDHDSDRHRHGTLPRTHPSNSLQCFSNFLSQKLHQDHQVLVLTNVDLLFLSPFTGLAEGNAICKAVRHQGLPAAQHCSVGSPGHQQLLPLLCPKSCQ